MRLIPFYLAFTGAILALFLVIEAPTSPSLEEFGAGKAAGIILGCFFFCLLVGYVFFLPYFHRRIIKNDARLKAYHIPLGPTLWRDDPWIYLPADPTGPAVVDYYKNAYYDDEVATETSSEKDGKFTEIADKTNGMSDPVSPNMNVDAEKQPRRRIMRPVTPRERFLSPNAHLPIFHPARMFGYVKYVLLRGVTIDCVSHESVRLHAVHSKAKHYDIRVEHLWTYAQVASAMLMSIAHGSNDVANAVGPWSAAYATFQSSMVDTESSTPTWMLVVAGILLGLGFWFFGYHIIKTLGNRITQMSPTRGFSMELGAAITVMLASRLSLPVSTTQCLVGATIGVALCNGSAGAVNWRRILIIFSGWVATLPAAGLISGILMVMVSALSTSQRSPS